MMEAIQFVTTWITFITIKTRILSSIGCLSFQINALEKSETPTSQVCSASNFLFMMLLKMDQSTSKISKHGKGKLPRDQTQSRLELISINAKTCQLQMLRELQIHSLLLGIQLPRSKKLRLSKTIATHFSMRQSNWNTK
jgi:hypothetical protein